jgi:hypothetical protein
MPSGPKPARHEYVIALHDLAIHPAPIRSSAASHSIGKDARLVWMASELPEFSSRRRHCCQINVEAPVAFRTLQSCCPKADGSFSSVELGAGVPDHTLQVGKLVRDVRFIDDFNLVDATVQHLPGLFERFTWLRCGHREFAVTARVLWPDDKSHFAHSQISWSFCADFRRESTLALGLSLLVGRQHQGAITLRLSGVQRVVQLNRATFLASSSTQVSSSAFRCSSPWNLSTS